MHSNKQKTSTLGNEDGVLASTGNGHNFALFKLLTEHSARFPCVLFVGTLP